MATCYFMHTLFSVSIYQGLLFYSIISERRTALFFFYHQPERMLNIRLRHSIRRYALTAKLQTSKGERKHRDILLRINFGKRYDHHIGAIVFNIAHLEDAVYKERVFSFFPFFNIRTQIE